MEPTEIKDTNINFRVTEQRKLNLQKDAESRKMTLSDLLNKIIEKHYTPPKIANPIPQEVKVLEEVKKDKNMGYLIVIVLGIVACVLIVVSSKKRHYNPYDWRPSIPEPTT